MEAPSAVCLDVAGVSRLQARIVVGEQRALLEDLGSEHGTGVDQVPVTGQVPLHDGDQLHVRPRGDHVSRISDAARR
jgi:pSer/pThr/pTyr-binding forkhead associated (FHA) protein